MITKLANTKKIVIEALKNKEPAAQNRVDVVRKP